MRKAVGSDTFDSIPKGGMTLKRLIANQTWKMGLGLVAALSTMAASNALAAEDAKPVAKTLIVPPGRGGGGAAAVGAASPWATDSTGEGGGSEGLGGAGFAAGAATSVVADRTEEDVAWEAAAARSVSCAAFSRARLARSSNEEIWDAVSDRSLLSRST